VESIQNEESESLNLNDEEAYLKIVKGHSVDAIISKPQMNFGIIGNPVDPSSNMSPNFMSSMNSSTTQFISPQSIPTPTLQSFPSIHTNTTFDNPQTPEEFEALFPSVPNKKKAASKIDSRRRGNAIFI